MTRRTLSRARCWLAWRKNPIGIGLPLLRSLDLGLKRARALLSKNTTGGTPVPSIHRIDRGNAVFNDSQLLEVLCERRHLASFDRAVVLSNVIPAQAGTYASFNTRFCLVEWESSQRVRTSLRVCRMLSWHSRRLAWVPACAGMTLMRKRQREGPGDAPDTACVRRAETGGTTAPQGVILGLAPRTQL